MLLYRLIPADIIIALTMAPPVTAGGSSPSSAATAPVSDDVALHADHRKAKRAKFVRLGERSSSSSSLLSRYEALRRRLFLVQEGVCAFPDSLLCPPRSDEKHDGSGSNSDLDALRGLFDEHGFRTSVVTSPRRALSIYIDSFGCCRRCRESPAENNDDDDDDVASVKEFLPVLFGLHPEQDEFEQFYGSSTKNAYWLLLFSSRLRETCRPSLGREKDDDLACLIQSAIQLCRSALLGASDSTGGEQVAMQLTTVVSPSSASQWFARLSQAASRADSRFRPEQLQHEYERICVLNSTLSNAYLQLFVRHNNLTIKDVYFKACTCSPKFERLTIYLYDPELDEGPPPPFSFLPCLRRVFAANGVQAVASSMVESFFDGLLRRGYYCPTQLRSDLEPHLQSYFLSGLISETLSLPLQL